jgi:hypothetical protein
MSRIYAKEIFSAMLQKEIDGHQRLLTEALPKVNAAYADEKLSSEAFTCFQQSQRMLSAAEGALKEEDFEKTLRFFVHAVSNYYLMLGDKGVLRHG